MKKILLFTLLLLPISVFAETVVKTPFSGIDGAYQRTTSSGSFYRADNSTNTIIYDNLGNTIANYNVPYGSSNNFANIYSPQDKIYHFKFGNTQVSSHARLYDGVVDLKNNIVSTHGFNRGVFTTFRCQSWVRVAMFEGKLVFRTYTGYYNNSFCPNSTYGGTHYYYDIYDDTHSVSTFTGSINSTLDLRSVYANQLTIISDNDILYRKASDPLKIFRFGCNEFGVCSESQYFEAQDTNTGAVIRNFDFIFTEASGYPFGGLNLDYGIPGGSGSLSFLEVSFTGSTGNWQVDDYTTVYGDTWVHNTSPNGNDYDLVLVRPADLVANGMNSFDMGQRPLILFDDTGGEQDFWYVRSNELYNFGSDYTGTVIGTGTSPNSPGGSGTGGINPGGSGTGSLGGNVASALGVDCTGTFSFISPVCWIDSLGEGLQNIPGFTVFSDRLTTYAQFFDFSLTPGEYNFDVELPTSNTNLEHEVHSFTMPTSYAPVNTPFSQSMNAETPITDYFFLLLGIILYYFGIIAFLGMVVFGMGFIIYNIIVVIVKKLSFGVIGSKSDTHGDSTVLGMIFMGVFFVALVAIFDTLFNPVLSTLADSFLIFKETYGHFVHFLVSIFTKGDVDLIATINTLNAFFLVAVAALILYVLFTKYGRLF